MLTIVFRAFMAALVGGSMGTCQMAHVAAGDKKNDHSAANDRLQGVWILMHETDHGRNLDDQLHSRFTLLIEKDRWTLREQGGDADKPWRVTLDWSHAPKHADFICLFGEDKGKVSRAIFDRNAETLTLCIADPGEPRPEKFDGNGNRTLLVLERKTDRAESAAGRQNRLDARQSLAD